MGIKKFIESVKESLNLDECEKKYLIKHQRSH